MGFVKASCQNSYYSSAKLEKKEKEQRRKELEEKIEQKARAKAEEKYQLLAASELELERYDQQYERMAKLVPESLRPSKEEYIIGALEEGEFREELREFLVLE